VALAAVVFLLPTVFQQKREQPEVGGPTLAATQPVTPAGREVAVGADRSGVTSTPGSSTPNGARTPTSAEGLQSPIASDDPKRTKQSSGPKRKLPDPPNELAFSAKTVKMSPGDRWNYIILSGDDSLDGKILKFTLEKREKDAFHFSAQLESGPPWQFVVKAEGTLAFLPREVSSGVFEVAGISSIPDSINQYSTWRSNNLHYTYDANGAQHTLGEKTAATGPCVCWVPAGQFVCAKFSHEAIEEGQAKLDGEYWLTPELPFGVRCRWQRATSVSSIFMELCSYKAAEQTRTASTSCVPEAARRAFIDWIKAHDKHGPHGPLVEHLLALFHIAIQDRPDKKVRWTIGSNLTKDGKGYVLQVEDEKFTVVEIPAGVQDEESKSHLKESIGEEEPASAIGRKGTRGDFVGIWSFTGQDWPPGIAFDFHQDGTLYVTAESQSTAVGRWKYEGGVLIFDTPKGKRARVSWVGDDEATLEGEGFPLTTIRRLKH
jgi:hypothetical protein